MSPNQTPLLQPTDSGLYCPTGGFHVDPCRPVDRAVVTHTHADHACWGCGHSSLYTDYTFGVWDPGTGSLVPIAKAYSGLTDDL
jgi:Cft2 family RNA processing exonuclease